MLERSAADHALANARLARPPPRFTLSLIAGITCTALRAVAR
jgi:hypothetical protein